METEKNKFTKLSNWLVRNSLTAIILFCLVSFVIVSIIYIFSHPEYLLPAELLYFIPVTIIFIIEIFVILKSIHIKHFLLFWSFVFILKSILIILCLNSPPQGDGGGIFDEALRLNKGGSFEFNQTNSYYTWYWLMWSVYFEKLFIDFFGVGYEFFKVIGAACLLGSGLVLYRITYNLINERISKITFGLYVLFAPISLCVSHFSHQHIAFFLLLLSIYLIMNESLYKWMLAGLMCGLMNAFRPWGTLLIISVGIYVFYCAFKNRNKILYRVILFVVFFVIYELTGICINQILINAGYIDPQSLGNTLMWLKIDSGIDPDYNAFRKDVASFLRSQSATNAELTLIKNEMHRNRVIGLLKTPATYIYIVNKMVRMFGEVDYWFENCFANKRSVLEYPARLLYFFNWFQYVITVIFALIGRFRNKNDKIINVLSIFTIGYFLAHILIEAFSSYRLCIYPLLLIYAAVGIDRVFNWCKNKNSLRFIRI